MAGMLEIEGVDGGVGGEMGGLHDKGAASGAVKSSASSEN
jgi:hypothetical protein